MHGCPCCLAWRYQHYSTEAMQLANLVNVNTGQLMLYDHLDGGVQWCRNCTVQVFYGGASIAGKNNISCSKGQHFLGKSVTQDNFTGGQFFSNTRTKNYSVIISVTRTNDYKNLGPPLKILVQTPKSILLRMKQLQHCMVQHCQTTFFFYIPSKYKRK